MQLQSCFTTKLFDFQTVSPSANIRFRLCEFVNLMLNSLPDDGDIEEFHCNEILSYMFDRLKVSGFAFFTVIGAVHII